MLILDVAGIDELLAEFEKMTIDELKQLEKEAVQEGAKIVQKNQIDNWNRSNKNDEHIKDNITIGRAYDMAEGTGISVGPKMSLRWRAKFVEYGTSRQPPQAPVERSAQQSEVAATNAMMNVLERVIE